MIPLDKGDFDARAQACRLLLLDVDGVLTDGGITLGETEELKTFHAQDGLGMTLARAAGLQLAVITGRDSTVVTRRCRELHVDHLMQGRPDKAAALAELSSSTGLALAEMAAMGDDWIDLPVLTAVGLAACPADARPEVAKHCHFVSRHPGGGGAVREWIDLLLHARGQHAGLLDLYLRGAGPAASASPAGQ